MYSSKDQWFDAWDAYYAKCGDTQSRLVHEMDVKSDATQDRRYYEECDRAHAAGMTLEEHQTYWNRTLAYYQAQPNDPSE